MPTATSTALDHLALPALLLCSLVIQTAALNSQKGICLMAKHGIRCTIFFLTAAFLLLPASILAEVQMVEGGDGVAFVDVGVDPTTGDVTLVGTAFDGLEDVAKVFYLSADRQSFTSSTLVGLGPDTQVGGISSDGSRIAGISKSPDSVGAGEGTTWLSAVPGEPVGIGLPSVGTQTSSGLGSWSGGVVGGQGGTQDTIIWTPGSGLEILDDGGGLSSALDVSANGAILVGFANSLVAGGGPAYWDTGVFDALPTPNGDQGSANAISPNAEFIGGGIDFLQLEPVFDAGTQAAVWKRVSDSYELMLLTNSDDSRFKGEVLDISNSGYAVGETSDGRGFIWHETFDGVQTPFDGPQLFDEWIADTTGLVLPTASKSVVGLADNPLTDDLIFAVNGSAYIVITPDPLAVPEPTTAGLLFAAAAVLFTSRRANR